ncbi:hypothetical protein D3C80_1420900 [compost metagenome]
MKAGDDLAVGGAYQSLEQRLGNSFLINGVVQSLPHTRIIKRLDIGVETDDLYARTWARTCHQITIAFKLCEILRCDNSRGINLAGFQAIDLGRSIDHNAELRLGEWCCLAEIMFIGFKANFALRIVAHQLIGAGAKSLNRWIV